MQVELNRLTEYVGRNLLCVTHSERPMREATCDLNYLERRYESPLRLPPRQRFDALRPSHEHNPYLGSVSLYDIGDDGTRSPELVCAFRPGTYKPQHALWHSDRLWVLGAEHINVYDAALRSIREIRDPWLAGNHTIAADGRGALLVSCSASDSVLTFSADTGDLTNAKRMPEDLYGSNYPLARHDSVVDHYITNDHQLTHVNCAWPWRRGVLISSLIQGALGWFDPDGSYHELLRGFVGCHGARVRSDVEELFFSDSCTGVVVFLDLHGRIIRRVGTGSRWLHDAIQIRGDIFAAAPFDQNEVLLLNIGSRTVISQIGCGARGGAQSLSFGVQRSEWGDSVDADRTSVGTSAFWRGRTTNGRDVINAALQRQQQGMVRARDVMIAAHAEEIRARDAIIAELRNERSQALAAHQAVIAEMDAARAREVGLRDGMLANQEVEHAREIKARDAIAAQLRTECAGAVATRDAMLAELSAQLAREVGTRDTMLAELSAEQAREVGTRDTMLIELGALRASEAADRDATIAELHTRIAKLHDELARTVASGEAIAGELQRDLMFATRGWRRWIIGQRRRTQDAPD